jgi:methylmalonyl-CoA mutase
MSNQEKLFGQFPPVSTKQWMDKITSDLKGADFNKKLVWKTKEGFDVMPFYRSEDIESLRHIYTLPGTFPFVRGSKTKNNSWLVRQNIEVADYGEANKKALDILMKGIDSLGFIISDPESITYENFETLLRDIHIESAELNFVSNGKAKDILAILKKILNSRGISYNKIKGAIEADPIGRLLLNGKLCISFDEGLDYLASLTKEAEDLSDLRTISINASHFNNAGSDIVTELAFGIAMGNEYMSILTDRGISADKAASKIRFSFGIGSNYFFEIAKLRAARLLWSVVARAYKPENTENCRMEIHSVTSEWNKTVYDPYVNMLRTQTEAMSASLGGTDSLTVEPFDIGFKKPDDFSERIARNQQLLLKEEAFFDKVADPAGGSYYIEKLTSLIAESTWKLFLEVEEQGGFVAAMKNGLVQKRVKDSASKRMSDVSKRKEILLGTNQYPDFNEMISPQVDKDKMFSKVVETEDLLIEPIRLFRGSEEIEKLRLNVDMSEKRPVVFMLTIGNIAMSKARSQFSCNFFACGGYHVIDNDVFGSVEQGVTAAFKANASIIVICSSDDEYATFAPAIFEKVGKKAIVAVAGNPASMDELRAKGIEYFVSLRSDILSTLSNFNNVLGLNGKEFNE